MRPVTITSEAAIKGGKSIRKLLLNEVLEALEEPIQAAAACFKEFSGQDEGSQLMRVKVKSEKDGREGYVTIQAVSGALDPPEQEAIEAKHGLFHPLSKGKSMNSIQKP